jgi:urea carboxylase
VAEALSSRPLPPARYSYGGDEHIFVELSEEMSLEAYFKGIAITSRLRAAKLPGVTEVCPANASYQVRFDPDVVAPGELLERLQGLEHSLAGQEAPPLETRIIDVPVFYGDPWTHETLMRFRERHQDPGGTDLDYAARINGFGSVQAFTEAHAGSPWFVSMVGFVAGLPFLYQMVPRERQIEVPKYLRPRTDTPALTVGHGGCFGCIYSVRGAGGYQMFGITPIPIYDPAQQLPDFQDFMIFFRPGDIVKFRAVGQAEYDALRAEVESGTYRAKQQPVTFHLNEFLTDPDAYNRRLVEALS